MTRRRWLDAHLLQREALAVAHAARDEDRRPVRHAVHIVEEEVAGATAGHSEGNYAEEDPPRLLTEKEEHERSVMVSTKVEPDMPHGATSGG